MGTGKGSALPSANILSQLFIKISYENPKNRKTEQKLKNAAACASLQPNEVPHFYR